MAIQKELLQEIRKPLFKTVSFDTVDRSSILHTEFLRGSLTEETVVAAKEDAFTIAFYYNECFKIVDYLRKMREEEITNITYNVMKLYLKDCTLEEVFEITQPVSSELGTKCLEALRGEIYRIKGVSILNGISEQSEYTVFGAVTIYNKYTPAFGSILEAFLPHNKAILDLLDYDDLTVQQEVSKHISIVFEYILESGAIYKLLDAINMKNFTCEMYVQLLSSANIPKDKRSSIYRKVFKRIECLNVLLNVSMCLFESPSCFYEFSPVIEKRVRKAPASSWPVGLIANFQRACFFHGKQIYFSDEVERHIELELGKFLEISEFTKIHNFILDATRDFSKLAVLYYNYSFYVKSNEPRLLDVLDFPEKFFVLSLDSSTDKNAPLLKEFNCNLHLDKTKGHISKQIDRDILVRYLIARNIWFNIPMEDYVDIMSDQYKLLYGANNLAWAANNLAELRRIGITHRLYTRLAGSEFKGLLTAEDKEAARKGLVDWETVSKYTSEYLNEGAERLLEPVKFEWKREMKAGLKDEDESKADDDSESSENVKRIKTELDCKLEILFNAIKAESQECVSVFDGIVAGTDYSYLVNGTFEWIKGSHYLKPFAEVVADTIPFFSVVYADFRELIRAVLAMYEGNRLIRSICSSVDNAGIKEIICDFPDYHRDIADGIMLAYRKGSFLDSDWKGIIKNPEYLKVMPAHSEYHSKNSISELIHSLIRTTGNSASHILAGLEAFPCLGIPLASPCDLLASPSDQIVAEAVKNIEKGLHNQALLKMLFSRGVLDELAASTIEKLDIAAVSQSDLNRIYSLFYVSPLNYILFGIHKYGLEITETMAVELIGAMAGIYNAELFVQFFDALSSFLFTEQCYNAIIHRLDTKNELFRSWALEKLAGAESISLPFFVKLSCLIANEDDLAVLEKFLVALKRIFKYSGGKGGLVNSADSKKIFAIILKWGQNQKFVRLSRRLLPLASADVDNYNKMLLRCPDKEESAMLRNIYEVKES